MPEINKPSDINKIWSAEGQIVVPADTKINSGWVEEIPPHEWENYIQNKQDLAIAHINQHGIPIWDSVTEYQANRSVVQTNDGRIWKATKTNTNINPTTDTNQNWFNTAETGFVVINTTGTTTWQVPAILKSGFKKPKVTITGGGASGASGSSTNRGGGGGAGGTAVGVIDLTGVDSVSVTVGAGGPRKTSSGQDGQGGGQTRFGSYMNANGGGLGGRYASGQTVSGGIGGTASGGQLNLKGGDGSDGPLSGNGSPGGSGDGGASFWGGGIRGGTGSSGSTVNQCPGSGGGGGTAISSPGANGVVVIEW